MSAPRRRAAPATKNGTAANGLRPAPRQRISDHVYDEVFKAIVNDRFRPGERISIADLASELDVSQMPVRQAIDRLAEDGLIEVRPRSGTFVAQPEERDVADTFDLRRALDGLAAETAVLHVTDKDISYLEATVERMDECAAAGNAGMQDHDRLNWEFHLFLVRLAGNERLYEMYEQLNAHLKIAGIHASNHDWAQRVPLAQREHGEMVRALARRDASSLAAVLAIHVERAKNALISDIRAVRSR
ncbi:MAG: GntR family transcriptional regulator [Bryobacterales bacterium]|nr:GntR family transcriptional regulator [Bryobacterales bacterium]